MARVPSKHSFLNGAQLPWLLCLGVCALFSSILVYHSQTTALGTQSLITRMQVLFIFSIAIGYFRARFKESFWIRFAFVFHISAYIWVLYEASGAAIRALGLSNRDAALISADEAIFGRIFPQGQISFWLDQEKWIGPETPLGKVFCEVLQVMYFSYYLWGGVLFIGLAILVLRNEVTKRSAVIREKSWSDWEFFARAWIGAYCINYIFYILVPAIGPQFIFAEQYAHNVRGFGFAGMIQDWIRAQQSTQQDCFPSGHTALSWISALMALRIWPKYGRVAVVAASLITAATLFLRYHYVVDLLAAIPLIYVSLAMGGYFGPLSAKKTRASL